MAPRHETKKRRRWLLLSTMWAYTRLPYLIYLSYLFEMEMRTYLFSLQAWAVFELKVASPFLHALLWEQHVLFRYLVFLPSGVHQRSCLLSNKFAHISPSSERTSTSTNLTFFWIDSYAGTAGVRLRRHVQGVTWRGTVARSVSTGTGRIIISCAAPWTAGRTYSVSLNNSEKCSLSYSFRSFWSHR